MSAKCIFVFSVYALFAQNALGQCLGRIAEPIAPCRAGLAYDGFGFDGLGYDAAWPRRAGCGAIAPALDISAVRSLNAAYGGGLEVASSSCAAPTGLAVTSENVYEGPVAVGGNLPFLGTAAMEGVFPTAGASAISYGCGDGAVAITAEAPISAAYAPADVVPGAIASTAAPWGYTGLQSRGCGCGAPYIY